MPVHSIHGYCEACGSHTCLYMIIDPSDTRGDTAQFLCRGCVTKKKPTVDIAEKASIPVLEIQD